MALVVTAFTKLLPAARHNYIEISVPIFTQLGEEK
jgi:hypothetical protein